MKYGAVFYTDGSTFRGNPAPCGCAVHGYFYTFEPETKKPNVTTVGYLSNATKVKLITNTDEALNDFIANKTPYVVKQLFEVNMARPLQVADPLRSTNNYAELMGVISGLELALKFNSLNEEKLSAVTIVSDSMYVINGINDYMPNWKMNNWRKSNGDPVLNDDLWFMIDKLIETVGDAMHLNFHWVRGHNGDYGNENADRLASLASTKAASNDFSCNEPRLLINVPDTYVEEVVVDAKGNSKTVKRKINTSNDVKRDVHPFFFTNRLVFNPSTIGVNNDHRKMYNLYSPPPVKGKDKEKADQLIGKESSDAYLAICLLQERDPYIDTLMIEQRRWLALKGRNTNVIVQGYLNNFLNNDLYDEIKTNGATVLHGSNDMVTNMFTYNDVPLTMVMEPQFLAARYVKQYIDMETSLTWFIEDEAGRLPNSHIKNDITDLIFETNTKGAVKLLDTITQQTKSIKVPVAIVADSKEKEIDVTLTLDLDLPPRNVLRRLEDYKPQVYLMVASESHLSFTYYVIIKLTTTNEYMIIKATQANRRVY